MPAPVNEKTIHLAWKASVRKASGAATEQQNPGPLSSFDGTKLSARMRSARSAPAIKPSKRQKMFV